jgi:hypothetical protein
MTGEEEREEMRRKLMIVKSIEDQNVSSHEAQGLSKDHRNLQDKTREIMWERVCQRESIKKGPSWRYSERKRRDMERSEERKRMRYPGIMKCHQCIASLIIRFPSEAMQRRSLRDSESLDHDER